jgi:trimeric autotransporter adhesin
MKAPVVPVESSCRGRASAAFSRRFGAGLALLAVTLVIGQQANAQSCAPGETPVSFGFSGGEQSVTVPAGVFSARLHVSGAQGGPGRSGAGTIGGSPNSPGGTGGLGGRVSGTLVTVPGQILSVWVGGQGTQAVNPGGIGQGVDGIGGGASDVRVGGNAIGNRVVIAGGGGGGGNAGWSTNNVIPGGNGGTGGGGAGGAGATVPGGPGPFGGGGGLVGAGGAGGAGCGAFPATEGNADNGDGGDSFNFSGSFTGAGFGGGGGGGATVGAGGGGGGVGTTACLQNWNGGGGGGAGGTSAAPGVTLVAINDGVQSGNGAVLVCFAPPAAADVVAGLTAAPDPVFAGANLTYTATAINNGPADADAVSISLPLPAGSSFVSATPSAGGTCNAVSPVVCTWAGATAAAATRAAAIVVAVGASQTANLSATATAASSTTDPTPANNTDTVTTTVNTAADVSIMLTDSPDPVTAGTNLTYTAVVSNAGPSDATGVAVTLPTPTNTSFVSGTVGGGGSCAGSPVVCTVTGTILPGSTRTVSIVMLVATAAPNASVINATAAVSAALPDPNAANNSASTTTSVIADANLALTLTASVTRALTNVPVTFTATSQNLGPSDAQNLSIMATLTPDFRYSSHTAMGATCTTPQVGTTGAITCTWSGATAPGVTRTLAVMAFSNVEGHNAVNVSTTSNITDPTPANNTASVSVQINEPLLIPTLNGLGLLLMGLLAGLGGFVAVRRQA